MAAIYICEYTLRSRQPLNALSGRREFRGALLRIGDGFACIHPWPELGDLALEGQLQRLREARPTPLIARAYRCAGLDGLARREGVNLFQGLRIPDSHALVAEETLESALQEGFDVLKLKCGPDMTAEPRRMDRLVARAPREAVRWRVDFNETLDEAAFVEWWGTLRGETRERIEFVEDPFPYEGRSWDRVQAECGVSLAVDRSAGRGPEGYRYAVVKPAVDDVEAVLGEARETGARAVFTSYMDHGLGQLYAAYEAARASLESAVTVDTCGLLTHRLFERDPFFERVQSEGPRLEIPGGTGLGFDEVLESLPWKKLI